MNDYTVHTTTGTWASPITRVYRVRAVDGVAAADTIRSLWYRSGQSDTIYIGSIRLTTDTESATAI